MQSSAHWPLTQCVPAAHWTLAHVGSMQSPLVMLQT
jgi:hypothetical protein